MVVYLEVCFTCCFKNPFVYEVFMDFFFVWGGVSGFSWLVLREGYVPF